MGFSFLLQVAVRVFLKRTRFVPFWIKSVSLEHVFIDNNKLFVFPHVEGKHTYC